MKKMIVTLVAAGLLAVGLGSWSDGNAAAAPAKADATYVVRYQYPYGGCPSYMMYQGYHLWLVWYTTIGGGGQYACQFAGWVP